MSENRWLILRLCDHIQVNTHLDYIIHDLKKTFGRDVDFYIPIHTELAHGRYMHIPVCDGYVFVKESSAVMRSNLKSMIYRSSILDDMLKESNGKPATLPQQDINRLKEAGRSTTSDYYPKIGEKVQAIQGVLKEMDAVVIAVDTEKKAIQIRITRRCREVDAWEKIFNIKRI